MAEVKSNKRMETSRPDVIEELERLDPSFYQFLKSQNPELLTFTHHEIPEPQIDEVESFHDISKSYSKKSDKKLLKISKNDMHTESEHLKKPAVELNCDMLRKWAAGCKNKSTSCFDRLVHSFHDIICENFGGNAAYQEKHLQQNVKITREGIVAKKSTKRIKSTIKSKNVKYITKDQDVLKDCIKKSLKYIPIFLNKIFVDKHTKLPHLMPKWRKLQPHIHMYIFSIQQIVSQKNTIIQPMYILKYSKMAFPYFHTFCELSKKLLENLVILSSHKNPKIRCKSLETIKDFVVAHSRYLTFTFKKLCSLYINNPKPNIYENHELNDAIFDAIEKLAILFPKETFSIIFDEFRAICRELRDCLSLQSKKKNQEFFNWTSIRKIDLWTKIVSINALTPETKFCELNYPLIQITFTITRLNNSPKYFPAQSHFLRFLLRLVSKDLYIPLIPFIFKILLSKEFQTPGTKTNEKFPLVRYMNHIPPILHQTQPMKEAMFDDIFDIFLQYISKMSESIAFPELGYFVTRWIKISMKSIKVVSFNKTLKAAVDNIEKTCQAIIDLRNQVNFGPDETEKISKWEKEHLVIGGDIGKSNPIHTYYKKWKAHQNSLIDQIIESHKKLEEHNSE